MKFSKPPTLNKGDKIVFVSLSSGLTGVFKYRVERAKKWFESRGFKVTYGKNWFKIGYIAGEPEERVSDINEAIYDKEVKAIISTIDGYHSIQLLKFIDFKALRKNSKFFVGFSDITVLHLAFFTASKVQTYYGPAVLAHFGEYPKPFDYTVAILVEPSVIAIIIISFLTALADLYFGKKIFR